MRVATNIGNSERNRPAELGGADASPRVPDQGDDNRDREDPPVHEPDRSRAQ